MSDPMMVRHQPVLAAELLRLLAPATGETWVDCTTGGGGHTHLIAERVGPNGQILALDRDPAMLELARSRLTGFRVMLIAASFDQLGDVLAANDIATVDGVLADLGFSSDQLENSQRGLSFQLDGPLDMRLNQAQGETAAQMVARLNERDLAKVIFEFGEERYSRRIARKIVESRQREPIHTTGQLADLVRQCVPRGKRQHAIDPATRTFQALRIAVNDELAALEGLLRQLPALVRRGGRVGVISFHSLEDRRVKQALRDKQTWRLLTRKPVQPGDEEMRTNPRSRSAKLRAAVRL
jgi:16S rRNA (cytosine1402-N4)-methyltransferase